MLKTIITKKEDNIVTNIIKSAEMVTNGLLVSDNIGTYIIARIEEDYNRYDNVETGNNIIPQKYFYTTANGFTLNLDYKPYISPEEEIKSLQSRLTATEDAILALMDMNLT
jgi:hypothetical protein